MACGFDVWLTSDHGNRESVDIGSPAEGAIAEIRSEGVRVYQSEDLRSRVAEKFATAIKWEPVGLPVDYLPLVASESTAFVQNGARIVGHGGISLEEVIVPLIRIEKKRKYLPDGHFCACRLVQTAAAPSRLSQPGPRNCSKNAVFRLVASSLGCNLRILPVLVQYSSTDRPFVQTAEQGNPKTDCRPPERTVW